VLLLKGVPTVAAAPGLPSLVSAAGNPGLATGGTGDVLAGICGGLMAQGLSREDAAMIGTYVHGLAGDKAAKRTGQMGLVASDLLAGLQEVWVEWGR
jgi:NAD(P)H-hydrate epimerase